MASSVGGVGSSSSDSTAAATKDAFSDMKMEDFINLMVTELQNQDPTNPMDNSQLLQQISQMRSIAATDQLNSTLDSVTLGQNLATASQLLQRTITGKDDKGADVAGKVDRVTIDDGVPKLHVGDQTVSLSNVSEIDPEGTTSTATKTTT